MEQLRAGSAIESHAIVLGTTPLRETDKLVRFLTLEHGAIAALARGAARSIKRFGGALEPMTYVKAHLCVPRDTQSEEPLWRVDRVDLRDSFLHLRSSYPALENTAFVLRLIGDLVPAASADPALFKALGRFLRDSALGDPADTTTWPRVAFWTWFAHHLGVGDLSAGVEHLMRQKDERWVQLWHNCFARPEPDFATFFHNLKLNPLPPLNSSDELRLYQRWVDLSGLHWEHFERWQLGKKPAY